MKSNIYDLVHHRRSVQSNQTLGEVFQQFTKTRCEFMAVLDGETLLGLCAERDIGMLLGSKYGYSLHAQKPIQDYLRPAHALVRVDTDPHAVFELVFARGEDTFYDDVLLTGPSGDFMGLISTLSLVRLQNSIHRKSIQLLEEQRRELARKNEQIETDLRLSRELQQALLPDRYPAFPPNSKPNSSLLRFHHYYRPLGMVGGDFFHVEQLSDMCAGVFMADVMGHGLRSALVTVMLRTLLEELQPESKKPGDLLALVNSEIYKILKELGKDVVYATALYLILDVAENTVTYASAGHPCPIRIGRNAEKVESLEHPNANTLLGLFEDMEFDSHTWEIEPEDSILIFTDGAFEVENNKGEEFGVERMLRLIENKINCSSVEIIEHIKEGVRDFSKNQNFTDDVCFLAIDIAHAF